MHAIGIDIGGTKIAGGVVNANGEILLKKQYPSPADDTQAMEDAVVALIRELSDEHEVAAAGVAAAGFISGNGSLVYYAPNIAWRNEPLKAKLEARLDVPVFIDNDANAAGWAEYRFGAGRGVKHMTMLTIGTGVGGAIIANRELFTGGFGAGAEIGHMRMVPEGLECGCGQRGCFEQYGSGRALMRYIREETGNATLTNDEGKELLASGDEAALRGLATLGTWIGTAAASLSAVLDPELYVIGGGVAPAGEALLAPIRDAFEANVSARGFHPAPQFVIAEFVNDAGIVGAADLARRHAKAE